MWLWWMTVLVPASRGILVSSSGTERVCGAPEWRQALALFPCPALFPALFLGRSLSPVAVHVFPVVPSIRVGFRWRQSHPGVGSTAPVWNQAVCLWDEMLAGARPCPWPRLPHCSALNPYVPMASAAIPLPLQFPPAAAAQPSPHLTPAPLLSDTRIRMFQFHLMLHPPQTDLTHSNLVSCSEFLSGRTVVLLTALPDSFLRLMFIC